MRATVGLCWMALLLASALNAQVSQCNCDPARPETMKARECSLCGEAEKQPANLEFFFLKDINPRKPNRWLALVRRHLPGGHHLHDLNKDERTRFWRAAITKAQELWGDAWGVAYNSEKVRTQCHLHLHIGKFITATENTRFKFVRRIEDFPAPSTEGVWIHPVGNAYHVHYGEQITETALLR